MFTVPPISATRPPAPVEIWPALTTAPPAPLNARRPAMKSASLRPRVDATNPPAALMRPVGATLMPCGLTRNTAPLAFKLPASCEAWGPVTIFSIEAPDEGCWNTTLLPWPILKPSQRMAAR
ncbi:hypothetical protein D3C72_1937790 [compost metagenome]